MRQHAVDFRLPARVISAIAYARGTWPPVECAAGDQRWCGVAPACARRQHLRTRSWYHKLDADHCRASARYGIAGGAARSSQGATNPARDRHMALTVYPYGLSGKIGGIA